MHKKKTSSPLGDNIRLARVIKNLSQTQLAKQAHLEQSNVSRIEAGHKASDKALLSIAQVFGISVEELRRSSAEQLARALTMPRGIPVEKTFEPEEEKVKETEGLISELGLSGTVEKIRNKIRRKEQELRED
jgi:transcriptional regulator with XRE-family HTH domain